MAKEYVTNKTAAFGHPHPLIQKTELIVGATLALITIFLHLVFMRHAGAFWRDEVNGIILATMPSISDIWHRLNYDSFPILISLILRFWMCLVTGSEWGLRVFGFLVGVSILGILWLNGRLLGYRVPLLSIALFAFSPLSIQIGDAIRPYGVGIFLLLLTFGLLWKVTQEARPWQVAAGTIAVILSVQCLYQNAFFILAAIFAGVVVTIRDKRWERVVLLVAVGIVSAISLLPYLQIVKNSRDWAVIMKHPIDFPLIWHTLLEALNASGWIICKIWIGLFILGICVYIYFQVVRLNPNTSKTQRDVTLFCTITTIIYVVLFLLFLRFVSVTIRVWYYLPLMAVAAVFLDVIFVNLNLWSVLRIALAILVATATFGVSWQTIHVCQTNMDIVASTLEKSAGKDDLIVVNPWYLAVSFQWHYHGTASFTTLPPIEDHKIHRYDLIKAKMASVDPIEPVLSEISKTLKSGGSVWVAGWIIVPPKDYLPQPLPPAPNSIYGWSEGAYTISWEQQFVYFLMSHSRRGSVLPPVTDKPVSSLENCSIMRFQGWR